jgi:alpha-L-rhamnosidase
VTWARAEYQSIRGRIACDWKLDGTTLRLSVVVPPNTTATVRVPTANAARVTESGKPVPATATEPGAARFEIGSGRYEFAAPFGP